MQAIRKKIAAPFPFAQVVEFLPGWAQDVVLDDSVEDKDKAEVKKRPRPDMIRWKVGFEDMTLAMDAAEIWPYAASKAHLRVCLKIAMEAMGEGRRHHLAQFYDEACRKEYAAKAARGDIDFDKNTAGLHLHV